MKSEVSRWQNTARVHSGYYLIGDGIYNFTLVNNCIRVLLLSSYSIDNTTPKTVNRGHYSRVQCTRLLYPFIRHWWYMSAKKEHTKTIAYLALAESWSDSKWLRVTPAGVTPEPLIARHILFLLRVLLRHFFDVLIRRSSGSNRPPSLSAERVVVNWGGDRYCCDRVVVKGDPTLTNCKLISATVWKQFYLAA